MRREFISVRPGEDSFSKIVSKVLETLQGLYEDSVGQGWVGMGRWAVKVRLTVVLGSVMQGFAGSGLSLWLEFWCPPLDTLLVGSFA